MAYVDSAPMRDSAPTKGKDAKGPNAQLQRYWKEIEAYNKTSSDWKEMSEKIVKMYLDQHRTAATARRFALLWSNIETLKPAVYAKTPTVLCSRRYKDPHPVGRTAAEILERATNTTFDLYKVDEVFRMVRDDRLLVARGQAWVRYEADFTKGKDSKGTEYDKVAGEKVCVDYVHWCDFGHNVAGTWKDVWVVWRKVYKTKDEATKRFTAKIADKLTYQSKVDPDGKEEYGEHTACIYEIWDKKKNQTVFISRDCPDFLEEPGDPPLEFRDFFPCPEPCYGSRTGKSLIPTPDYRYYQDQAMEIDDLTDRIANLTEFLQVKAFVPSGPSADGADAIRIMIQSLQSQMTSSKSVFIPVESWAGWTEKGGAGKLVDWLPIDMVMKALQGAVETRNQLIQDVYQITGIADILRGQTDPQETLGAQELKAQTGQRRVRNTKDELGRFCRDIGQLVAEVIAEQFNPQTLAEMTGYAYQPMMPAQDPAQAQMAATPSPMGQMNGQQMPQMGSPPMQPGMPLGMPGMASPPMQPGMPQQQSPSRQTFNDEVIALLRSDRMRGFLIDIETDSTIQPDEDAEKQRRVEFVTAVGGFMREALPAAQMSPAIIPMLGETLLFMARGFRAGRSLEEVIERSMQQLQQQVAQSQGQPNPEVQKMQMQAQADQAKMQMQMQSEAQKLELEKQRLQMEQQAEMGRLQMEQEKQVNELRIKEMELQIKEREGQQKLEFEAQKAQLDAQRDEMSMRHDMQLAEMKQRHEEEMAQRDAAVKEQLARDEADIKRQRDDEEFSANQGRAQQEFDFKTRLQADEHKNKIKLSQIESAARIENEGKLAKEGAAKKDKERAERKKQPRKLTVTPKGDSYDVQIH